VNQGSPLLDFLRDPPPVGPPRFWEISRGQQLAWNEYGAPDGHPTLYYHGWPSSRLQARLTHHLACERGLRIIAIDRPGMGQSTFAAGRQLSDWPELMGRFADAHKIEKFSQLGVSGGGPYALSCAAKIPDRLGRSVVLAGAVPLGAPNLKPHGLHPVYRLLIPLRKRLPCGAFTALFRLAEMATRLDPATPPMRWLLNTLAKEDRRVLLENPDVWEIIGESFREGVHRGGGRAVMADADIFFQPLDFDLKAITHPIRYWHGAEDKNIPLEMVTSFVAMIPSARLEIADDLGHFSMVILGAAAAMDDLAECMPKGLV
jgi:pimeloyl-ACP methyl ester carboxylesterase